MLRVACGQERDRLEESIGDLFSHDGLAASYPHEPALTRAQALAVLAEVIAEHDRVVPDFSPDARAVLQSFGTLRARGVPVSFADGWDKREAAIAGHELALRVRGALGYAYLTEQDLETVVLTGVLRLGYSDMTGAAEPMVAVGRIVADSLAQAGLPVAWDGTAGRRIAVGPIVFERPFEYF